MITAKEALDLSANLDSVKVAALLERADRSIRTTAAEGERSSRLMFDSNECNAALARKIISVLQHNGFSVICNSWSDQRDGSAYHQIDVTW